MILYIFYNKSLIKAFHFLSFNYKYNLRNKDKHRMRKQDQIYLLLSIKSLTQNRKDKKYLLRVKNIDSGSHCEIENIFQHSYEYIYKLWACSLTAREFVKIELFERSGQDLIKRGQASPLVLYSYEGEKFQFSCSKDQKCVLILKFKVNSLEMMEQELSNKELQILNEQIDAELTKNKNELKQYHSYLEYTNKFLDKLDNSRYIKPKEPKKMEEVMESPEEQEVEEKVDSPSREKYVWQPTSAGKQTTFVEKRSPYAHQSLSSKIQTNSIPNDIRKRRDRYTKNSKSLKESIQFNQSKNQQPNRQLESKQSNKSEENLQKNVIIRTNDFPISQPKAEIADTHRKNERRRKYYSENKQTKQSYETALKKLEDVDLEKIFETPEKQEALKGKIMRIELSSIKAHLYRGNFDLPKKLVILHHTSRHQTQGEDMKNKSVQWKTKLLIPKASTISILQCKLASIHDYGLSEEGEAHILVNDLIRSSQFVKVYLYENGVAIGFLQFEYEAQAYVQELTPIKEVPTFRVDRERKTVSLPQINQPSNRHQKCKTTKEETNESSVRNVSQSIKICRDKLSAKEGSSSEQVKTQCLADKIKEKKLKIKSKFK